MSLTCPPGDVARNFDGRAGRAERAAGTTGDRDFGLADPGELPGYRVGDLPG